MRRPSATCRMFIEITDGGTGPVTGDYIVTYGKRGMGSGYLVLKVRQIKRRDHAALPRYQMICQRVPADEALRFRHFRMTKLVLKLVHAVL